MSPPAAQQCPECRSPLRPCECGREERKRRRQLKRNREWRRRGAEAYEERVRQEYLDGDRSWGGLPPANRKRKEAEWRRAYGSEERAAWVRSLPSVVSGEGPCVNAHVPDADEGPSGMGRKADAKWVVPLTLEEELELHAKGIKTFQREHGGVNLSAEARQIDAAWKQRQAEETA